MMPFATQWLDEITSSKPARSKSSMAAGKNGREGPGVAAQAGRPLQEAGVDRMALDRRADAAGEMKEGEDRRLGEDRAQLREHLLAAARSEEHTSELQSHEHLVCRLLLA